MTKYCPRCGAQNPDNAQFCSSCGYSLQSVYSSSSTPPSQSPPTSSPQSPPPTWNPQGGYTPPGYVKPLYQQALELFTRNLGMIIPALLALIITLVLGFAIGLITVALLPLISFTVIRGIAFVIGFIVGIVITFLIQLEAYESVDVMNGMVPDVGSAWRRTTANTGTILPTALLVGLIYGLLALAGVPGAFVIEGLVLILAYVITSHLALGRAMGLGASLNWYSNSFSRDGNSAVVVLIGSILSTIPILNLFTIPYTSLLSTLMARNYP